MNIENLTAADASTQPSWSACIPTLNRFDVLQICVRCLLAQTCLPKQVIVIDASQDAEEHRRALTPMFDGYGVDFIFEAADEKSSTVQRNQGMAKVESDIVVFMDDDSLLFPNCAEDFLATFARDQVKAIAGLALLNVDALPPAAQEVLGNAEPRVKIEQKKGGATANLRLLTRLNRIPLWRFFRREILMQAMDRMFVPYDHRRSRPSHYSIAKDAGLVTIRHLPGYGMAVRAEIARAEPFNPHLLAYCPCEDLDASYRFGRHGICAYSQGAQLKHYEVQGGRITRMQATSLGVSNVALFVHTNSDAPLRHRAAFFVFAARRLLGETLKDLLARRFGFPQARGVLIAIPRSVGIFRRSLPDAQNWYIEEQRNLLKSGK